MDGKLLFLGLIIGILILAWVGAGVLWRAAEMAEIVAPLDRRTAAELEVVALGTGNEYENPERLGPSTAIVHGETVVLVDAGRGVARGPAQREDPGRPAGGRPADEPAAAEHAGPRRSRLDTGWLSGRSTALRVVGPTGTRALVDGLDAAHAPGRDALGVSLELPAEGGRFVVVEVGDGHAEELGALRLEARELPGGPLPTLAWRFTAGEHRVVVSGSGWGREALTRFAANADVLVHEAAYLPTPEELEGTGAEMPASRAPRPRSEAAHLDPRRRRPRARSAGGAPRAGPAATAALLRAAGPLDRRQRRSRGRSSCRRTARSSIPDRRPCDGPARRGAGRTGGLEAPLELPRDTQGLRLVSVRQRPPDPLEDTLPRLRRDARRASRRSRVRSAAAR
jgi:hypothetical protein